ncbi:hypothetical protein EV175_004506 [Coemansia sp. RSA 1933]|nr:hypothetical protein EV175_004506 [Coemansia sp. RSA 1933]
MYLIAGRGRKGTGTSKSQQPPNSSNNTAASVTLPAPSGRHEPDGVDGIDIGGLGIGKHSSDFDDDDDDGGFDDADLDDPELLGELEAMRREMGHHEPPPQPPAASTEQQRETTKAPPAKNALYLDEDEAVESVTVTEHDMSDPGLLAELAGFSSSSSSHGTAPTNKLDRDTAAVEPSRQSSPADVTIEALKERHQEFKRLALVAKRQGDMGQAREMLVRMKSMQAEIDRAQSGEAVSAPLSSETTPPSTKPKIQQQQEKEQQQMSGALVGVNASRHQTSKVTQLQNQGISGTLSTTPDAAVSASRDQPPPPPRSHAPSTTAQAKAASAPKRARNVDSSTLEDIEQQRSEFGELASSFAAMKQKLESQITEATKLAAYYLKIGEKTLALDFHRLKKRSAADLATVDSFEANDRRLPPSFLHREVQWTVAAEQRRDISVSELQVTVKRVFSDGDLASTLGGKCDFYVQWESGWPRDKNTKGYTRTVKYNEFESSGGDVDVGYTHNVEFVDRHLVRPLQRWIERGKLTVELHKYMGILWGSQLVGRASVPLLDLRTKSEVSRLVEIKAVSDGTGRVGKPLLGGPVFVDVAARLRLPLTNKPELVTRSEQWIYLDSQDDRDREQPRVAAAAAAAALPQRQTTDPAVDEVASAGKDNSKPSANNTVKDDEAGQSQIPSADEIAEQMDSMETVFSNAVLEMELQLIPARVRDAAGDKEHAGALQDLETAIKLRMSVVAAQVGAGTLTVKDYVDNVAKEQKQATQWGLTAKRLGRKDLALRALRRVKVMRSELGEMEAAMSTE